MTAPSYSPTKSAVLSSVLMFVVLCAGASSAVDLNSCGGIDASGSYVLTQDVSTNSTCFDVRADDVTLDCGGRRITGDSQSAGDYEDHGVHIGERMGATIRNCVISGFETGIFMISASGSKVYNNTLINNSHNAMGFVSSSGNDIYDNTMSGANDRAGTGIALDKESSGNRVFNNSISIANATFLRHGVSITAGGKDNLVSGNTINMSGGDTCYCLVIAFEGSTGNRMENNTCTFRSTAQEEQSFQMFPPAGIAVALGSSGNNFSGNRIAVTGLRAYGVFLLDSNSTVFLENEIGSETAYIFASDKAIGASFTNTTFLAANGSVRYPGTMLIEGGAEVVFSEEDLAGLDVSYKEAGGFSTVRLSPSGLSLFLSQKGDKLIMAAAAVAAAACIWFIICGKPGKRKRHRKAHRKAR